MRAAAALLSSARSVGGLSDLVRATGLASDPVIVDTDFSSALGLTGVDGAALAAGVGSLRILLLELSCPESLRDALQRIARRLSAEAPHVVWLAAAVDAGGGHAGIVGWSGGERSPRVAAFLWEPEHVVDSDAETLCALASVRADSDVLLHARCLEVLGREALTRRFYRILDAQVGALASALPRRVDHSDARELALLCVSRLLFLRFLEAKGWLNGEREFVAARFDACMRERRDFHGRVLRPLFFGTLNTPFSKRAARAREFGRVPFLNGGLFARTAMERRVGPLDFPDEHLGALLQQLFQRFRFVAREDSASWSDASVDPEMLGRAFESLMASGERQASGVFYTPHEFVARVAKHALEPAMSARELGELRSFRVLDPACGSGAFLVFILERLAELRRRRGDTGTLASIRRDVLARSVFGVDRNPTAVWLCELRLWLSVVVESEEPDPMRVPPLPNLDRNIRVGDALAGPGFSPDRLAVLGAARVAALRQRYARATGARKQNLARALDREERRRALEQADHLVAARQHARRERLAAQRARDLFGERVAPSPESRREFKRLKEQLRHHRSERRRIGDGGALAFSFSAFFADVQASGGFDVVLGNPPWVRLHRIPAALRARLKESYEVYRLAHWQSGARTARVAPGFASQVDLAALFVERSVSVLRPGGTVALLLPVKLWRSLAGGGVRQYLTTRARLSRLEDLSASKHAFDAVVYPSLMVARTGECAPPRIALAVHQRLGERQWLSTLEGVAFDATPGAPWIMLPPEARESFERLRRVGVPLAESAFGAPRLGVKSGCNAAFLVRVVSSARGLATVVDPDGESGSVECALLRPVLRGDGLRPWARMEGGESIVWTHDETGAPLSRLPDRARAWLQRHYGALAGRADATGAKRWWSLFRVDAANCNVARVVWADFGRRPRALVLEAGDPTVPLNTCYVLRCPDECDAWAIAALLNSPLAAAWLNALAEPARGGYRRYLGWTVGQLPLPIDWARARSLLSRAAEQARSRGADGRTADEALLESVLAAYGLGRPDVEALLDHAP